MSLASGAEAENESFKTIPKKHFLSTGRTSPGDGSVWFIFPSFQTLFLHSLLCSFQAPESKLTVAVMGEPGDWLLPPLGLSFFHILSCSLSALPGKQAGSTSHHRSVSGSMPILSWSHVKAWATLTFPVTADNCWTSAHASGLREVVALLAWCQRPVCP